MVTEDIWNFISLFVSCIKVFLDILKLSNFVSLDLFLMSNNEK